MAKISKRFNTGDTLLALTSYPDPQNGVKDLNAIASYAKRTIAYMAHGRKVIILAEQSGRKKTDQEGENLYIHRIWNKNPLSMASVLQVMIKYYNVRDILIQFEFTMFGGMSSVAAIVLLVCILKLLRKNIYIEQHEVIRDIAAIEDHIGIHNKHMQRAVNTAFSLFYRIMGIMAAKIIILEEALKDRLTDVIDSKKIVVIPHVVHRERTMPKNQSRADTYAVHDFVVLAFGFLNWYKGSDWIIEQFAKHPHPGIKLLVAGGKSPTMKIKGYYASYFNRITSLVKKSKSIRLTGYMPEEEISRYFSMSDLVVLPYRYFLAASGPFSRALSYRKPVIFSDALKDYARNPDFQEAMEKSDLAMEDLFFPLHPVGMFTLIEKARHDEEYYKKLCKFSAILGSKRDVKHIVRYYEDVCFPHQLKAEVYKYAFK